LSILRPYPTRMTVCQWRIFLSSRWSFGKGDRSRPPSHGTVQRGSGPIIPVQASFSFDDPPPPPGGSGVGSGWLGLARPNHPTGLTGNLPQETRPLSKPPAPASAPGQHTAVASAPGPCTAAGPPTLAAAPRHPQGTTTGPTADPGLPGISFNVGSRTYQATMPPPHHELLETYAIVHRQGIRICPHLSGGGEVEHQP